jgi:hypothetical protein
VAVLREAGYTDEHIEELLASGACRGAEAAQTETS